MKTTLVIFIWQHNRHEEALVGVFSQAGMFTWRWMLSVVTVTPILKIFWLCAGLWSTKQPMIQQFLKTS